jgi:hypothetical protein
LGTRRHAQPGHRVGARPAPPLRAGGSRASGAVGAALTALRSG